MAYQKLQGYRVLPVIYSDTINIPNISNHNASGTNTSVVVNRLVQTGGNFTNRVKQGNIVYNTTNNTVATVERVIDNDNLLLSADIFTASPETFDIYTDDNPGAVLYIGGAGNIKVLTSGNDIVTFTALLAGTYFPVQVKKIFATDTTVAANTINAIW